MPTLTIKTASIEKLKQLGIYDQWIANVKVQWGHHPQTQEITHKHRSYVSDLLLYGFDWVKSIEGNDYWSKLYHENNPNAT